MNCLFKEPWIGQCKEQAIEVQYCCEKHSQEKCQVCGEQAFTRCQASIGLMCGTPLCELCGKGEMCLYHATSGPLVIIKGLLNGGPTSSIFSFPEHMESERLKTIQKIDRLKKFKFGIKLDISIEQQIKDAEILSQERKMKESKNTV